MASDCNWSGEGVFYDGEFCSGMGEKGKRNRLKNKKAEAERNAGNGSRDAAIADLEYGPGRIMDCVEKFWQVLPEDVWGREHRWNVVSGRDVGRSGKSRDDTSWDNESEELIDLGLTLDEFAPEPRWKKDYAGAILWKMTKRDNWIEEKLKIRTKTQGNIPFVLNAVQGEYSRVCLENLAKRNIVLKARQLGITSYIAARLFVQTITRRGTLTMLVAHDREAAEEIFRIVHRFWDNLPLKLQEGPLKTSHSSARELVFPRLDSEFTVTSADENAGRGRTIQNLHCTEVSRWGRAGEDALASLRAAVVPDGEIVLESTANGAWGSFYKEWQQAEETGYTQHFFPWWFEESYQSKPEPSFEMTEEEAVLAAAHGLTPEKITWRRQQWASLRRMAAQEFAEDAVTCFRASGDCVFELEVIEKALAAARDPIEERDNRHLSVWLPPQAGKKYVMGVDPAGGGVDGDYSCAQVIDRKLGTQCAELHGHFSLRELGDRLIALAKEYNGALVAVERNNHGHAVLAHLETENYQNVYVDDDGKVGWNTTGASRPPMIEGLAEMLVERPDLFQSAKLWNECRTFVRSANGAPAAAPGAHDDCVMAMGIAVAVRDKAAGKRLRMEKTNNPDVAGVTSGQGV